MVSSTLAISFFSNPFDHFFFFFLPFFLSFFLSLSISHSFHISHSSFFFLSLLSTFSLVYEERLNRQRDLCEEKWITSISILSFVKGREREGGREREREREREEREKKKRKEQKKRKKERNRKKGEREV